MAVLFASFCVAQESVADQRERLAEQLEHLADTQKKHFALIAEVQSYWSNMEMLVGRIKDQTNRFLLPFPVDMNILTNRPNPLPSFPTIEQTNLIILAQEIQSLTTYVQTLRPQLEPCRKIVKQFSHQHNELFLEQPQRYQGLSKQDAKAIVLLIEQTDGIDQRILGIKTLDEKNVEVGTGIVKGPLSGGGNTLLLRKDSGTWQVAKVADWLSANNAQPSDAPAAVDRFAAVPRRADGAGRCGMLAARDDS